jgi:hypothetical protein
MSNNDINKYDDIINLPHHVSSERPRMSMSQRAAQFAPFAALSGYDEAVREERRLTEERIEIDENMIEILNGKLEVIQSLLPDCPEALITYFIPDEDKEGGAYVTVANAIRTIKIYERQIIMDDGTIIPIDDIIEIESELFNNMDIE